MTAKVFSIIAGKGGVGKTTISTGLGLIAQKYYDKKVLFIDCDQQCGLENTLIRERANEGLGQCLSLHDDIKDYVLKSEDYPPIGVMPGNLKSPDTARTLFTYQEI